jgi:glycogen debranching enzyme
LGGSNSAYSLKDQHALNPDFKTDWASLEKFTAKLRSERGVLSLCDIVLNHTSYDSEWIKREPDATYNCVNSPHLRPACILDRLLFRLAMDIGEGKWVQQGIPKAEVSNEEHLQAAKQVLKSHYLPMVKIQELFMLDVESMTAQFEKTLRDCAKPQNGPLEQMSDSKCLELIQDHGMKYGPLSLNSFK